MYYATCAKVKERLDDINIRLSNGFIQPNDDYFTYDSKGFGLTDPVTAGAWKATLTLHEEFLYDPLVEGIMNRAVLLKQKRALETTATLPLPRGTSKVPGLRNVCNMSCGMIFGGLSEKYRVIVQREEFEKARARPFKTSDAFPASHPASTHKVLRISSGSIPIVHQSSKRSKANTIATVQASYINHYGNTAQGEVVHEPSHDHQPTQHHETMNKPHRYISPYNLDERAKKLNRPDAPEKPCICDPECMCAPLCASNPTQNCFCEANGLFRRVTKGMDINEWSYPTKAEEEEEVEKAGKEYMAQLMGVDRDQQQAFEYSSTIGQYSTLEPVEAHSAPVDVVQLESSAYAPYQTMANGQPDLPAELRKLLFGGSLSIWAVESPDGERYRDLSSHWHDDMRAAIEAKILSSPPDPDFYYPHSISQGRLNLQRISEQCPTAGQRLMKFTRESIRFKKASAQIKASEPSLGRIDDVDGMPHQGVHTKPMSKVSLFASRLIGRSSQASSRPNGGKSMDFIQTRYQAANTSKAAPHSLQ